jgi:uncharacterized delta-60 repeat protein
MKLIQQKLISAFILILALQTALFAQVPGTLDSSFAVNGMQILKPSNGFENVNDMIVLPDDRIIGAGFTTNDQAEWDAAAFRLNADGSLDSSFGIDGFTIFDVAGYYDIVHAVTTTNDGKILLAGGAIQTNFADIDFFVARLDENGDLDPAFGTNGIVRIFTDGGEDLVYAIKVQPDGKILCAGQDQPNGFTYLRGVILRLEADGQIDSSFGTNGVVTNDFDYDYVRYNDLLLNEDGSIIATGGASNTDYEIVLAKYDSDGQLVPDFGSNGAMTYEFKSGDDVAWTIGRHPGSGRILVGGQVSTSSSKTDFLLMAIDENGTLDTMFADSGLAVINAKTKDVLLDMAFQPNGRIVVCGLAGTSSLGSQDWTVARFEEDGAVDSSFGVSGGYTITEAGSFFSEAAAIGLQSSGRIITGGIAANSENDMGVLGYYGDDIATGTPAVTGNDADDLNLFPNPSNGHFMLSADPANAGQGTLQIINAVGQVIYHQNIAVSKGHYEERFSEELFSESGLYFIKLAVNGSEYSGKIMIQK